jgi:hypothetical protein
MLAFSNIEKFERFSLTFKRTKVRPRVHTSFHENPSTISTINGAESEGYTNIATPLPAFSHEHEKQSK